MTAKVALVTGGGTGLGAATAACLVRDGFRVFICGRRAGRLAEIPGTEALACDITDAAQLARLAQQLEQAAGRLDLLVNNAGVSWADPIERFPPEKMAYLVSVNLLGTMLATQAVLPLLLAARGCVVNLSSALVPHPTPGTAVYAATKAGVEAFTRAMALELGPRGVRVNAVQPGLVRSEIWLAAGMPEDAYERLLADRAARYPLGRMGEPEEVGEMVAYLASARAAWITGAVVPVCGGSALGYAPVASPWGKPAPLSNGASAPTSCG